MTSFLDTNIILYLVGPESERKNKAQELIKAGGIVSVQVLNEFINVARRKSKLTLPTILEALAAITEDFQIVPLSVEAQKRATEIALATNLHIYDSNIVAAAQLAGCDVLYSEDMKNGQRIGGVTICNPFA